MFFDLPGEVGDFDDSESDQEEWDKEEDAEGDGSGAGLTMQDLSKEQSNASRSLC